LHKIFQTANLNQRFGVLQNRLAQHYIQGNTYLFGAILNYLFGAILNNLLIATYMALLSEMGRDNKGEQSGKLGKKSFCLQIHIFYNNESAIIWL